MIRIVAPYRPFAPESAPHRKLGTFDWIGALRMQRASALAVGLDAVAISDLELPVPHLRYQTTETRLMLWILDVCLRYLESKDFDRPTAMVSPDILVFGDISRFADADFGIIVRLREKFIESGKVFLNSVQFWHPRAQDALVAFYREALALAKTLPEHLIVWGADTVPIQQLLEPFDAGYIDRHGMRVRCIEEREVLTGLNAPTALALEKGIAPAWPTLPLVDFKNQRKKYLRAYFDATLGAKVTA